MSQDFSKFATKSAMALSRAKFREIYRARSAVVALDDRLSRISSSTARASSRPTKFFRKVENDKRRSGKVRKAEWATTAALTAFAEQQSPPRRSTRFTPELPPAYHSPQQQRRSPRRGLEASLGAAGSA